MTEKIIPQESDLDSIGEQVAGLIDDFLEPDAEYLNAESRGEETFELSYPFELWVIDLSDRTKADSLDAVAKWSKRWHHQVRYKEKAIGYALSKLDPDKERSWIVSEVVKSKVAEKIDDAIMQIRENKDLKDDSELRLLSLQDYRVCAFWMKDAGEVYVIDCPSSFKYLRPKEELHQEKFLNGLLMEAPIIGRIGSRDDDYQR